MTIALILNIVLSAVVAGGIVGLLGWASATAHRDHGVFAAGRPRLGRGRS